MSAESPQDAAPSLEPASKKRLDRPVVFRHRIQYAAMRAAFFVVGLLGFRAASNFGAWLGRVFMRLGVRRGVVEKQIAACFPHWKPDQVTRTALAAYEHLGRTSIEAAILSRCSKEEILGMFDRCNSWDVIENALAKGNGVIFVCGHLGNWEVMGAYVAMRSHELAVIARQQENPLFDAYVTRTRERLGMQVIWDGDAVRRVPRVMRRNGQVAIMIDQGAAGLASTWVPFFGRWAKTPRGAGTFALRFDAPIIFMNTFRKPDGRFNIHFEPVPYTVTGDKAKDVDHIMERCTEVLEHWVRRYPEQYFWHHRRWKHQRPGTPKEQGNPLE